MSFTEKVMRFFRKLVGRKDNPLSDIRKKSLFFDVMSEWAEAPAKVAKLSNEAIKKLIETNGTPESLQFAGACELAKRNRIDTLTELLTGDSHVVQAASGGLAYAACEGNLSAIEALATAMNNPSAQVRLRIVRDAAMVADGAPGQNGSSTAEIHSCAQSIVQTSMHDSNGEVRQLAAQLLEKTKNVYDVRSGDVKLTYLGQRVAAIALEVAVKTNAQKDAITRLLHALCHKDFTVREQAAHTLEQMSNPRAVDL